jgi:hypothetical protein
MRNGPALAAICWSWARSRAALMAKPMAVTLPLVLLLLDFWPLRRANRLVILWEKLPLFALAAGASLVTLSPSNKATPSNPSVSCRPVCGSPIRW